MKEYFDLTAVNGDTMNYRWLQPPQIAYFISTLDEYGNPNLTPVTLGTLNCAQYSRNGKPGSYFFSFSMGCNDLYNKDDIILHRQGFENLQKGRQCVVSYVTHNVINESIVSCMPIPHGISEFDVAGLTPIKSSKVKPYSIKECPVNMECEVVETFDMDGYYKFFICRIVSVSVDKEYIDNDDANDGRGIYAADPVFEVQISKIKNGAARLCYGRLDPQKLDFPGEDFGCLKDWVGTFEQWISDECTRGKITKEEQAHIMELNEKWNKNRDGKANAEVKAELTSLLKKICITKK